VKRRLFSFFSRRHHSKSNFPKGGSILTKSGSILTKSGSILTKSGRSPKKATLFQNFWKSARFSEIWSEIVEKFAPSSLFSQMWQIGRAFFTFSWSEAPRPGEARVPTYIYIYIYTWYPGTGGYLCIYIYIYIQGGSVRLGRGSLLTI